MAPRRKNKRKNETDRLNKLAATLGINVDKLMEEVPLTEIGAEAVVRHELEAESVLFFIEARGKGFDQKNCLKCGGLFLHTYIGVKYCSDECRASALADKGLIWNFHRRPLSERWNARGKGFIPKVIGVEATAALIDAKYVIPKLPLQVDTEEIEIPEQEIPYSSDVTVYDKEDVE